MKPANPVHPAITARKKDWISHQNAYVWKVKRRYNNIQYLYDFSSLFLFFISKAGNQTSWTSYSRLYFSGDNIEFSGYFCPPGSSTPNAEICRPGYECPAGSGKEIPCPDGKYSEAEKSNACEECPPGKYCMVDKNNGTGVINPTECPAGFYCPGSSKLGWPRHFSGW